MFTFLNIQKQPLADIIHSILLLHTLKSLLFTK